MPRTRSEYEAATDSIKRILKQQGLTYKNLAIRLGLSESGVKKILTAQDGSFQRLAQISRELGITMGELLTGEEEAMFELSYSREQQAYLVKEPRALRLYWALVYERRDLKEALSFLHLLPKDAFPILRRLDELRLIELLPEGRLRIPPVRQIRWVGEEIGRAHV